MPVGTFVGLRLVDHVQDILDRKWSGVQGIRVRQAARTGGLSVVIVVATRLSLLLMVLQHPRSAITGPLEKHFDLNKSNNLPNRT